MQRIRDEAHRFAVTFHRQARTMRDLRSELDDVPGIGPRRRRTLLTTFGSVAGVRRATREELAAAVVGAKSADARPCVFRESAVTCNVLAGHRLRADFHRVHRAAVLPDGARDGACLDGRSPRRSDGAAARPRVAEPDRACRSDRHGAVSAGRDRRRRAAHRLGEAGAGRTSRDLRRSAARLRAGRGRRAGEQSAARGRRRRCCCACVPVSPVTLGEPNVSAPIASLLSRAVQLNVLLAVFNMIPIPPLDGGNVLAGLLPRPLAAPFNTVRPYGFILLYALMFTGGFDVISSCPPYRLAASLGCPRSDCSKAARRVRHAADRPPAPRPSGRRARQLGAAAGRSTTASTSSPTGTR